MCSYIGPATLKMPDVFLMPPKPHVDLFVHFDPEDLFNLADESPCGPVQAAGMSGCGMFLLNSVRTGELWEPGALPLVGIQHMWFPEHMLFRGTRSEHIITLMNLFTAELRQRGVFR